MAISRVRACIALIYTTAVVGCGPSEISRLRAENEDLRGQVSQLQEQLGDVRAKAENLETASDELKSQMGRFNAENWRDVMPAAQAASSDVDDAQSEVKDAADDDD